MNVDKLRRVLIFLLKLYQVFVSPLVGKKCRFYPSCSQYTIEVLNKYDLKKSILFILKRFLKCHPFNAGGYDPVK